MEDWSSAEAGLFEEVNVLSYIKVLELLRLQHKYYTGIVEYALQYVTISCHKIISIIFLKCQPGSKTFS